MELIPFFADAVKIEVEEEDITFWVEVNPLLPEYPSTLVKKAKRILSNGKNLYFLIRFKNTVCLFKVSCLGISKYMPQHTTPFRDYLYVTLEPYGSKLSDFKNLFDFPLYRAAIALNVTGVFFISEGKPNHKELKEIGTAYLSLLSHREIRQKAYEFVRNNLEKEK